MTIKPSSEIDKLDKLTFPLSRTRLIRNVRKRTFGHLHPAKNQVRLFTQAGQNLDGWGGEGGGGGGRRVTLG